MTAVSIIFPHQLYNDQPCLSKGRSVLLVEDELFFNQYQFHKQKLVLHRSSMQWYQSHLVQRGYDVTYIEARQCRTPGGYSTISALTGVDQIHYTETTDYLLERRLRRFALKHNIALTSYPSPGFICSVEYIQQYFSTGKKYFLNDFYIEQRKRLGILIDHGKPAGGIWSYDVENRKKIPARLPIPPQHEYQPSRFREEGLRYVKKEFGDNYGSIENFNYPITREEALNGLERFLEDRFLNYGPYQDAIVATDSFLFHSVLTPALNVGLITPDEVIDKSVSYANTHSIPLNSIEGFIRQMLGWREYIRAVYIRESVKQRTTNYWEHKRKIPLHFWNGTTGIVPVDNVIKKVIDTGYSNHIERLMIIGNFMLVCEFDPDEVYHWFMTLYIDAYDWVMVPNVYGMSQFSDGGLISTKPYISGSNYVLKMSNFPKGEWCEIWDALYWCFIDKHKTFFASNPRTSMVAKLQERIDPGRMDKLRRTRDLFFRKLDM